MRKRRLRELKFSGKCYRVTQEIVQMSGHAASPGQSRFGRDTCSALRGKRVVMIGRMLLASSG